MGKITIERETLERAMSVSHEIRPYTFPGVTLWRRVAAIIAAIDDALSAAQPAEPVMTIGVDESEKCRSLPFGMKLYAAPLAPAQQEPVAWLHICVKPGRREVYATVDPDDNKWWPADQWTSHTVHPLYAAPPAPAAVPLTDEKIDHTLATALDEFARTTRGMSHALDVNADITANSRLRRMFARAMIAAAGDKP